jgi:hypothetical protein
MKFIWVILAAILLLIILNPPDFERRSKAEELTPIPVPTFYYNAVAKPVSLVPGAIVCPDFPRVSLVFDLYVDYGGDAIQDAMTHGQSTILRGPSAPAPDPTLYGCSLLKPGTGVYVKNSDAFTTGIPMVRAQLPDGTIINGVTLPSMLTAIPLPSPATKSSD